MHTLKDNPPISGIHHITAVAASAADNFRFYTRVLGLRLVKKTVNFDDPFTYHLYYGDDTGSPGTLLTFFPREGLPQGKPGTGMVSAIAFAIPRASVDHWTRRLAEQGVTLAAESRFGEPVIRFADPHGLPLELIGIPPGDDLSGRTPDSQAAIIGFHSATLLIDRIDATQRIIVDGMGMTPDQHEGNRCRFAMQDERAPGHLLDVIVDPSAGRGRSGGGHRPPHRLSYPGQPGTTGMAATAPAARRVRHRRSRPYLLPVHLFQRTGRCSLRNRHRPAGVQGG